MPKVILISQIPLPYQTIGSWSMLYHSYLNSSHEIDYIICEKPTYFYPNIEYHFVEDSKYLKLKKKYSKNKYSGYLNALDGILEDNEKYIIQVVDNFGIVASLQSYLESKNQECYIQFFYHGHAPFFENFASRSFYDFINEMVVLTHLSYIAHKEYYTVLPCRFNVLYNGIDTSRFYKLPSTEKSKLKKSLDLEHKRVFIWCSQDRPKKGLDFILDVWQRLSKKYNDIVLLVAGATREISMENVRFLGRIPNEKLSKYYQVSEVYLFPTLWHEGFGLSLIEALHSGCYCIASALGGVPEVLDHGRYGRLIETPHFVEAWEKAIIEYLENPVNSIEIPNDLYTADAWNNNMNRMILEAKEALRN